MLITFGLVVAVTGAAGTVGRSLTRDAGIPATKLIVRDNSPFRTGLVSPRRMQQRLTEEGDAPLILDLSSASRYADRHLPNAIHGNWRDGVEVNVLSFGQVLASDDEIAAWLQSLGIDGTRDIVVYDDASNIHAARVVWMLHSVGIARAAVLDGGLGAWLGSGFPTESAEHSAATVSPPRIRRQSGMIINSAELNESLTGPLPAIVDVRSPAERQNDLDGSIRTGQIARSISLPSDMLLYPNGQFRAIPELVGAFSAAGLDPQMPIVLYGMFGSDTGTVWLAMQLAGFSNVRVYDEGWMFWAGPTDFPIDSFPADS